jgi:hypothetical protein
MSERMRSLGGSSTPAGRRKSSSDEDLVAVCRLFGERGAIAHMHDRDVKVSKLNTTLALVGTNVKGNKATTAFDDIFNGP